MENFFLILLMVWIVLGAGTTQIMGVHSAKASAGQDPRCPPTPAQPLGPFYQANAPERSQVGQGYRLEGEVRSSLDCRPLARARIEFWLAGPDGRYDDDHRATVFSDPSGK